MQQDVIIMEAKERMEKYLNENIKKLVPYKLEELEYDIKLDANENPFSIPEILPEEAKNRLKERLFGELWNHYPDPEAKELRWKIAAKNGLKIENILLGNGSDELLLYIFMAYLNSQKAVVVHPPCFSMYGIMAQEMNAPVVEVPLNPKNFELDIEKMEEAVSKEENAVTVITYPNNPTGQLFNREYVERVIKKAKGLVIIDEAYYEFAGDTFIDKINEYKNIIVLRTFSKAFGIAGLRIGYMAACKELVESINKVRLPYNINKLTQAAAAELMEYQDYFNDMIKELISERERMIEVMSEIRELKLYKSDSNSIFFSTEKSEEIFKKMLENRILIRKFKGNMSKFLRISIGKKEENDKVLGILKDVCS